MLDTAEPLTRPLPARERGKVKLDIFIFEKELMREWISVGCKFY
jgi:hypothetical protein